MSKGKTLEDYREALVGKKFGRLLVLDVQKRIVKSTGKSNGCDAVCLCDCGNKKIIYAYLLLKGHTQSCGCLQKEKARNNIKEAHKWNESHPEEMKKIREKGISSMLKWQKEHPEEASKQKKECFEKCQLWQKEHPDKMRSFLDKAHTWQKEHPEEFKKSLEENISKAHKWNEGHPEEMRVIRAKGVSSMRKWHKENPDKSSLFSKENIKKAHLWHKEHPKESLRKKKKIFLSLFSKEERKVYDYLMSLGYHVERQYLVEDHYYDFKVNNFLIEYNGSIYHYSEYENLDSPDSKNPPSLKKELYYHKNLLDTALKNGYNLIQVWDYDWINRKDFVKKLIKDQLDGNANYKEYIEDGLLNNDYGFNVEGVLVEPHSLWITTANIKQIVDESYTKGRVLIYNSGYTRIKSEG